MEQQSTNEEQMNGQWLDRRTIQNDKQSNKSFGGLTSNMSASSNKEKESLKDSGKKKVKFETSSNYSGDDFEMVGSAKNDGVIKNDAQAKRF
uniref:Uncharacterized protein n=1 Tax=Meloidogyne floridensis TaxID=298350 RepID=A0A915P451_9BILA